MRPVALIVLLEYSDGGRCRQGYKLVLRPDPPRPPRPSDDGQDHIAAVPFLTDDQAHTRFRQGDPYKHGVLPVLVVFENGTGKTLRLDLVAEFVDTDGKHIDATPAGGRDRIGGITKPPKLPGQNPLPFPNA